MGVQRVPVTPYVPQTSSHDATDGALSRASRSRSAATTPECQTKTPQTVATAANTVNPVRTQSTGPTRPTSLRITTTPPSGAATKRHPDKQPSRRRPRQAPSQPRPRNPRPRRSPASKTTPEPSHPREKPRSRLPHHDVRRQTKIRILPNLHRHARRLRQGLHDPIPGRKIHLIDTAARLHRIPERPDNLTGRPQQLHTRNHHHTVPQHRNLAIPGVPERLHRRIPATNPLRRLNDGVTDEIHRIRHDGLPFHGPSQARPYQHDADRRTRPRAGNRTPPKAPAPGQPLANLPPHSLDQTIREALSPADVHRPRHRLPLPSNHQHAPLRPTIHPEPRPTSALPAIDLHIGDTPRPIRLHTITIPKLGLPRSPNDPSRHLTLELPHRLPQSPPMSRTLETLHTEVPVHDPAQRQQAPNPRIRQRLHIAAQTLEPHSPRRTRPIPVAHEPQILRRSLNPPRTRPRLGQSHDNHSLPETPHGTIPAAGPAQGNDPWNRQHGARRSAPVKHALGRSRKMLHAILTRGQHLVHDVPDRPGDVEPIHQRSPPRSAAATAAAQRSVSAGPSQ